jgi:hypothetical protein
MPAQMSQAVPRDMAVFSGIPMSRRWPEGCYAGGAMRAVWIGTLAVALVAACTDEVERPPIAAGGGGSSESCGVPDTSCPAAQPHPGAPCEGSLACTYGDPDIPWHFACADGRWDGEPDCSMVVGGCPPPEPAEGRGPAFTGQLPAGVEIGPAVVLGETFRPYQPNEPIEVVWGGQGSAMIYYRLALDTDAPPTCVNVRATIAAPGIPPETSTETVRLRCGESLRMYVVVPAGPCEGSTAPVDTTVHVEVDGVGEADVTLAVPADAFCGALG